MPVITKLEKAALAEIRDHRDNTSKELIKTYTLTQLSFMDWVDTRTVKTSGRYLPVRIDSWTKQYDFKNWRTKKAYTVKYIRLDELRYIYNKRTWKKLVIDL